MNGKKRGATHPIDRYGRGREGGGISSGDVGTTRLVGPRRKNKHGRVGGPHYYRSSFSSSSSSTNRGDLPGIEELLSGPADVKRVTLARRASSSKRDYGYVLVIGGSDIYSGAPALVALAALRAGAGLSIIAAPEGIASVIRSFSPTLIVHPLPGGFVSTRHVEYIKRKILGRVNSVVIGPGLGTHSETREAVKGITEIVVGSKLPLVVDADAITSLKGNLDIIRGGNVVLTPNEGEFEKVSGVSPAGDWRQRAIAAMSFAKKRKKKAGCTVLLKGHNTVITDGVQLRINGTGNPSMATGGSGDVLSGIIATYLAQGRDSFSAAVAGAYVHGLAGDLVMREKGFHATAMDIVEKLPEAMKPFDTTDD